MMKRTVIILAVLLIVGGTIGGAWWYISHNPEWWFWLQGEFKKAIDELGLQAKPPVPGLFVSGFIEADEASVTTELGGRIIALYADEGDEVEKGQVLVRLDDSLLVGQIEVSQADLAMAEAMLAQVKAGAPPAKLNTARAELDQAVEAQEAARVAWEDARAMRDNPQDLELSIVAARAQLQVLEYQAKQAQALANSAQAGRDMTDQVVGMLEDFEPFTVHIPVAPGVEVAKRIKLPSDALPDARYQQALATYQSWTAWTGLDQAQAAQSGAESYLAQLSKQAINPLTLQAQADAAGSQYEVAVANVALAQAQVAGLEMGATPQQIAAAEAQVEVARAAVETLRVQTDKYTLVAPISGLVLERPVQVGEVAMPGAPQMTLGDLDNLTLTVYVPEDQLGQVELGQPVSVTVDAYPDRVFMGTVKFIASQAEFTPKNVQTKEERVSMVFAVKVRLPNPDHALKPGMPADAVLLAGGQPGK
jgi:HlyD family secretion protein